ncbi:hypothetical protein GCM10010503_35350 [Streptomyces lucensis JCM 4490]|uniref:Uncharacterized protein n=1 Tax=Streptomyces lucensis JCM 4490 TaxID=1306176 RepID=A0A918J8G8_9ACTN|nr:hypothetical protein [Streptomyces lucensis]GGW55252.1 hypothetical protein GCM10010503_35350 [Streptomyces lucensis JCM 4490]
MPELELNVGQKATVRRYFRFATTLMVIGVVALTAGAVTGYTRAWIGVAIIFLMWALFAVWYRALER